MEQDRPPPPPADELTAKVYNELRRLAGAFMRRERPGQTLQATALVHEAYLRLAGAGTPWRDERHFVGIAARSMRQILVERARARGAQKRWGGLDRVTLIDSLIGARAEDAMLPALDDALARLEAIDPEQARIVELRFFGGLSIEEAATAMDISPATLKRRWTLARAWLFRELSDSGVMTPEQHRRVREIFEAAVDRDAAERRAWVARQAADDPAIRDEVLSLLDHHERAGAFLSQPIVERVPELLTDDTVLMPGTTLGAYTVIRELGRGGMGRVYLASDARLGRQVALKALAPHLTRDPMHRERLRREARAAAGLTHPGICAVYALEETDDDLFIVTEYVDGVTLREEITSGRRPSAAEIVRTAREIAAALAAAHARGVIHRDLKPENIMRARDGRLKILDFGLARIEAASLSQTFVTEPGVLIGTPAYMAPEQLNGGVVDVRADIFAFGALIYEYICGVHPFAAATPLATVARVLESDARPLAHQCPHAPIAVLDCIERCLRKAPDQRFHSGADLVLALDRADEPAGRRAGATWWRTHQLVIIGVYLAASSLGWQIKEWVNVPMTVSLFIALGVGSAIGGVLRGHLVFTEHFNRQNLAVERRRAAPALMIVDVLMAMALVADATMLLAWPLTAVLTMGLGVGIALAALVLEPATTRAVLGDR